MYQEFDFGINPGLYGYRPGDSLSNVTLKIVYKGKDNSRLKTELKFYDVHDSLKCTTCEHCYLNTATSELCM